MRELTIGPNDAGQRLDKYLTKALPALPQSLLHKYIRLKRIKVGGKRAELSYRLAEGDVLQLYINDEFFQAPDPDQAWKKVRPQLDILYEDEHILLVNKPAGLVVHEDESQTPNTLINQIKAYLFQSGAWDPESERSFVPALCNRIDRNTGGIVLAAKTAPALRILNEKIRDREIAKYYLCLVHGAPRPASPWWSASCSPGGPTRSASRWPRRATPWRGTPNTARRGRTGVSPFPTRRYGAGGCGSIFPPPRGSWNTSGGWRFRWRTSRSWIFFVLSRKNKIEHSRGIA